ncbi:hypothetical protein [Stieleria varia]|uniref:Uncharacterized protein n=1 Tax=Stieleria varia TaxID=2528005 RepID=A0A5C5ZY18_9BACT|nr:hypothetical protein [Stieleria varia]TWT92056.1 hypothetical protein Pla52n_63530 [Stieleria varia]
MNQQTDQRPTSRLSGSDLRYLAIVALPIVGLLIVIMVAIMSWMVGASQVRAARLQYTDGSDVSINQWFTQRMDSESSMDQTARWKRILDSATAIVKSPAFAIVEASTAADNHLGIDDAKEACAEIANQAAPVLAELDELRAESSKPIWLPIEFNGISTLLPEFEQSRNLARLLQADLIDAFHQDDTTRALQTLRRFDVFNEQHATLHLIICDLLQISCVDTQFKMVEETLQHDFWSDEELAQVAEIIRANDDVGDRWRQTVLDELRIELAVIEELSDVFTADVPRGLISTAPSFIKSHFELMNQLADLRGAGTVSHVESVSRLVDLYSDDRGAAKQRSRSLDTLLQLPVSDESVVLNMIRPSFSSFAEALYKHQRAKRRVLTAIAIKQYQTREGRLPTNLGELWDAGTSTADLLTTDGDPFVYELADDGESAVLKDYIGDPRIEDDEWQDKSWHTIVIK